MPRVLTIIALLALVGCQPLPPVTGWDPGGVNCEENSAPFIDNVQINSAYVGEAELWLMVMGFKWADPGSGGAVDPPNLQGGEFSLELSGMSSEDTLLTQSILETGCGGDTDPELGTASYCSLVNVGSGCPNGGVATCSTAALAFPGFIIPVNGSEGPVEGDEIEVELRIRDVCGMASNSKNATYFLGQGLIIENPDE